MADPAGRWASVDGAGSDGKSALPKNGSLPMLFQILVG
jgi:hypothetical protein